MNEHDLQREAERAGRAHHATSGKAADWETTWRGLHPLLIAIVGIDEAAVQGALHDLWRRAALRGADTTEAQTTGRLFT